MVCIGRDLEGHRVPNPLENFIPLHETCLFQLSQLTSHLCVALTVKNTSTRSVYRSLKMNLVESGGRGRNAPSILLIIACCFPIWALKRGGSVPNLQAQLFLAV